MIHLLTITCQIQAQNSVENTIENNNYLQFRLDDAQINELVEKAISTSYVLKALDAERLQKREIVKQRRIGVLENFAVGVQLYSFNQNFETATTTGGLLPNVGLNMRVNLFGIATYRSNIKYAKADVVRTENDIKRQKQILKNWVEQKYLDYLMVLEVIEMRSNVLVSLEAQLALTKQRFEKGEAKVETYLKIQNGVENTKESLLRTKMEARKIFQELINFTTEVNA